MFFFHADMTVLIYVAATFVAITITITIVVVVSTVTTVFLAATVIFTREHRVANRYISFSGYDSDKS
jgi:hypothetical protein